MFSLPYCVSTDQSHLVHISCAKETVWSVDSDGRVYHRIGVKAPSDRSLNAAWLPVDNGETVFTQIVSCEEEWKVSVDDFKSRNLEWYNNFQSSS